MSIRRSHVATAILVVAALVLMSGRSWAIYYALGPSKDEWGLKYDVTIQDADSDTVTVVLTVADEGRLKPIYSIDVVAFSKQLDSQGGRSYDVKARIELKPTDDGQRAGQVQIPKKFAAGAKIRILTQMVDGKRQPSGGSYYDIPLAKYLSKTPAAPPLASPPASKVTR